MSTTAIGSQAARDEFLLLLVTQLRHQDPLDPVKQEDFLSQLAQFSTLEGIERLNANFASLLALQELTQGSNLIGRTVSYRSTADGPVRSGTVQSIATSDGQIQLTINGETVPLDRVTGISA